MSSCRSQSWRRSAAGGGDHNNNTGNNNRTTMSATSSRLSTTRRTSHHRPGGGEMTPTNNNTDAPSLAATAGATDVQGDLFDFGMSLNVSDDQRRGIHEEIKGIDTANDKIHKGLTEEHKTEEQLKKELNYSKKEQLNLNEGASDQAESTRMYYIVNKDIDKQFQTDIVTPQICSDRQRKNKSHGSSSISSSPSTLPAFSNPITPEGRFNKSHTGNEEEAGASSGKKTTTTTPTTSRESNRCILDGKNSIGTSTYRTLWNEDRAIKNTEREEESLQEKRRQLEQAMELQGLRSSLERAQWEVRRNQSDVQQDQDAKATRVVEIQHSHDSSGTKAQQITDLTKRLHEIKKSNAEAEADRLRNCQVVKAEVEALQKQKEEKMMISEQQKRKLQECTHQMQEYHAYRQTKEEFNTAAILRREKKKEGAARLLDIQKQLQEQQSMQQASLAHLEQVQEAAALVQAKKTENSDVEARIILPGKAELVTLAEEKMKLAEQIGAASKHSEQAQTQEREALMVQREAHKVAQEQVEQLQAEHQTVLQQKETTHQEQQAFRTVQEEQLASYQSFEEKFVAMYQTEEQVYEEKYEARRVQLSNELHDRSQELLSQHETKLVEVEVLETGLHLLQRAQQAEEEEEHDEE